jgi:hypothetical protein
MSTVERIAVRLGGELAASDRGATHLPSKRLPRPASQFEKGAALVLPRQVSSASLLPAQMGLAFLSRSPS